MENLPKKFNLNPHDASFGFTEISGLPDEIQNKIFFYYAEHPCAVMIKDELQAIPRFLTFLGEECFCEFREHLFLKMYRIKYRRERNIGDMFGEYESNGSVSTDRYGDYESEASSEDSSLQSLFSSTLSNLKILLPRNTLLTIPS